MEENKEQFPRKGSSGGGTTPAYSVEARMNNGEPKTIGGVIYHGGWKRVHFQKVPEGFGVPNNTFCKSADHLGLLTYQAANALRWWFHANNEHAYCLETRILKHQIEHSYTETIISEHQIVGGEDRSSFIPDFKPTK